MSKYVLFGDGSGLNMDKIISFHPDAGGTFTINLENKKSHSLNDSASIARFKDAIRQYQKAELEQMRLSKEKVELKEQSLKQREDYLLAKKFALGGTEYKAAEKDFHKASTA